MENLLVEDDTINMKHKENKTCKLTPRLQLIADMVPAGTRVADIGTDHAYIPIYLVTKGIATYAIASDVRPGPVGKALENVKKYGLTNSIDIRLGNGLETIKPGEVDVIIIAGMGGILITDILTASKRVLNNIKRLILQPMIAQEEVRRWLAENHFIIADEALAAEGHKIYNIIAAEPGDEKIEKEIYYSVGKKLIEKRDPLLGTWLIKSINTMERILMQMEDKDSNNVCILREEFKKKIWEYEKIKKMIEKE
ncbi:MAG: SAM-dependent methyltransferase [Clostridiaceae bacterium]|nr:SAM-dependent methyltransferase [Clostridiaceae bacterium]